MDKSRVANELGLWRIYPMRAEAGHGEGRHDPIGFAEIVPAHAGDFEDGEALGTKRQHSM